MSESTILLDILTIIYGAVKFVGFIAGTIEHRVLHDDVAYTLLRTSYDRLSVILIFFILLLFLTMKYLMTSYRFKNDANATTVFETTLFCIPNVLILMLIFYYNNAYIQLLCKV